MPKVLIQAGHLRPLEPGISGTGAAGEVEMVKAIRDALISLLRADPRFDATPAGGDLPNGKKVDAALFLHCDGASPRPAGSASRIRSRVPATASSPTASAPST